MVAGLKGANEHCRVHLPGHCAECGFVKRTRIIFSWLSVILYSSLLVTLSVLPYEVPEGLTFPLFDKVFHGLAYTLLSFIVVNTVSGRLTLPPRVFGFSYAVVLGCLIELVQLLLPYRSFEGTDILSNAIGSFMGC